MAKQRHALVVDDSKAARLVLSRMLEKYDLVVDAVESAAEALEFLIHNRPDVIFMDHMMPGMDGFEAVKAIKNNPATATIPVLMYTSKGGDLYLGQARALGAVGVLPKTVAPAELFDSLQRLGLVQERRAEERGLGEDDASERAEDIHARGIPAARFTEPGMPPETLDTGQFDKHLRYLLDEQRTEIRKDFLLSIDTVARNTGNRFQREFDERLDALSNRPAPRHTTLPFAVAALSVVMLLSLAWNMALHYRQPPPVTVISSDPAPAANAQSLVDADSEALGELRELHAETVALLSRAWEHIGWAMNQSMQYPFDELALDGARVDTVEALLSRLAETGFTGVVVLETHAGEFCLLGDEEKGFRLPPGDLTVDQCEFIGSPTQPGNLPASRQSLRFANFVNSSELLSDYGISLEVTAASGPTPLQPYPEHSAETTAAAWNQAAAANNTVLVRIRPLQP